MYYHEVIVYFFTHDIVVIDIGKCVWANEGVAQRFSQEKYVEEGENHILLRHVYDLYLVRQAEE